MHIPLVAQLVAILFVLSTSILWYRSDSSLTRRRVLHPGHPTGSVGNNGGSGSGGSASGGGSSSWNGDVSGGSSPSDALCSSEALLAIGAYDVASNDATLWTAYESSAMATSQASTSACQNSAICSMLATPFIAQEYCSSSANRRLQTQASGAYTIWSANVTFFISNSTLELEYSKCLCERKAIQLAVHEVTSSTKELKYVSLPALALLTENGEGFGSRAAVYSVRMRIASLVSSASLESVVVALANSFSSSSTRKLLTSNSNNPISASIRSFAQSESLAQGARAIVSSFACTSPQLCQTPLQPLVPSPMPTLVPTSRPGVPTMAPVRTQSPTPAFDNPVTRASLQTQCTKYMTDNFSSALWGLYGANYELTQDNDSDAAAKTSKLSQTTSFYGVWLSLLLAGWCVVGLYVVWKVCIGYAACGANWQALKEGFSRPAEIAWFAPPSKSARQFMAICVISVMVFVRIVYLSLVMSLTKTQQYSSFTCVELSPYVIGGEKFVRTGMFFVLYGLYAPLLLLAVLLRKGIVDAVAQQIGIVLVKPMSAAGSGARSSRVLTPPMRPAVRIISIVGAFVASSSIVALFIAYFSGTAPADMNGSIEEDAAEDGPWSEVRHWSLITQILCSCTALVVQLYLPHPQAASAPNSNAAFDTKLARQYESYAANVPDPSHVSRTHAAMDHQRARSLNETETRRAETRATAIQRADRQRSRSSSPSTALNQPREEGLRQRNNTSSTSSSRENTADSEEDGTHQDSSNNGKAKKFVAGSGRTIERGSKNSVPETQVYEQQQPGGGSTLHPVHNHRYDISNLNVMASYPPPPRINDQLSWHVMAVTCCVTIVTAIPDVTTSSWFGSFVLYSSLQRVLELMTACCCLRYVEVERSYLRRRFLTQCEQVQFQRSGARGATDLQASFPTVSIASIGGDTHTFDGDIEAPAPTDVASSHVRLALHPRREPDDQTSTSESERSRSPQQHWQAARESLQSVSSAHAGSPESNLPRLTIRDGQPSRHKHYRFPRSSSQQTDSTGSSGGGGSGSGRKSNRKRRGGTSDTLVGSELGDNAA